MATYKQIQAWVKQYYGFVPETCWIADAKSQTGCQYEESLIAKDQSGSNYALLTRRSLYHRFSVTLG